MRQCPGPETIEANQRCSPICPTCCGPEWLTPLGTIRAHSIRTVRDCCCRCNSLVTGLTRFLIVSPLYFVNAKKKLNLNIKEK